MDNNNLLNNQDEEERRRRENQQNPNNVNPNVLNNNIRNNNDNVQNNENNNVQNNENQNNPVNQNNADQNNLQNRQNQNNPQNNEQPPAEEEEVEGREFLSNEELITKGTRASGDLKDAKLFLRGSKEFKNASNKFNRVQELWKKYQELENPTTEEVARLRGEVMNAMHMADAYLGKKEDEKDESKNAKKRVESMEGAFSQLEEQYAILNNKLEELENEPAPTFGKLSLSGDDALKQMKDAKLFLRGSEEYDDAIEAFEKANQRLADLKEKYAGREEEMPPTELEDCREEFLRAQGAVVGYILKKTGQVLSSNTQKRVDAAYSANAVLVETVKKMEQMDEAFEKAPAKATSVVSEKTSDALSDLENADVGVRFGSDEYKDAKEAVTVSSKQLKEFAEKGDDYKPSFQELEQMRTNTEDALSKIDAYLATKKGKDLSATTQKRVDAMKKAKNALLETRKKFRDFNKENMEKADEYTEKDLGLKDDQIVTNLREYHRYVDGSRVWFGSQEFKDGMNAYSDITRKEERIANSGKVPTEKELEAQIKDLTKAQETMYKYIEKKEKEIKDKGKPLDNKGQKRLAEMKAAYAQVSIRKARAESKLEATTEKGKKIQQKKIDNRVKEIDKAIKGKTGVELSDAIVTSEAAHTLQKRGKKKSLTAGEKSGVKRAIASLLLHEKLNSPEGAELKKKMPKTLKGYAKKLNEIMESKEFKDLFPDSELTPDKIRKLMADPKEVKRALKAFDENVKKSAEKQKLKDNHGKKKENTKQEIEMQNFKPH